MVCPRDGKTPNNSGKSRMVSRMDDLWSTLMI